MRKALLTAVVLAVLPAAPAAAQGPDPAFAPTALEQYPKARERGLDQLRHPEFLARTNAGGVVALGLDDDGSVFNEDPFRRRWAPDRGVQVPVAFENRYGATLRGTLYAPKGDGKHPGVILLTGGGGPEIALREFSQGLAEAGYLVLGLAVQGDLGSDAAPRDPVPSTPENEFCRPHDFGGWQQPQEMGLVERATCAGGFEPRPDPVTGAQRTVDGADEAAAGLAGYYRGLVADEVDLGPVEAFYEHVKARKTFGALDAAAWLRSKDNPLRDRLAGGELGIAGHSLGAHGALLAGNGDPKGRFGAVVTWDGFGTIAPTTSPRVPTLFFQHEIDQGLPKQRALVASKFPAYRDAERFREAGVRTGVVVPDGSTHQDFNFINYPVLWPVLATLFTCPDCIPGANASRDGTRVALHYTRAWLDRELKGASSDALRTRTYPASADASSIGQGAWDAAALRNVPYTIGGETAADKLSPLLPSFVPGCADLRKGC